LATIYIDNQPHHVRDGMNLLDACLSLGFDVPYFCWHPAMGSVGACRQCAVKQFRDANDTAGRIVMACMTPADDGTRISIDDPQAVDFRARVIEWLMTSHPHDCPVCDEGGECHLQDMTVMTGHVYRRCRQPKRTHRNQYLGPFVTHEMNRCIQCYRCVRFYRDYAGGRDLDVFGWHDNVYFGRQADGPLESEFAGNLVEVCPTGVFTDKTLYRHYARKWDLQTAPSICPHCSVGCNTLPGERYGTLRRIRDRFNYDVNGYFLCDRGRYGYEFVNSGDRIRTAALGRKARGRRPASPAEALAAMRAMLMRGGVVALGSPRASVESNYALMRLAGGDKGRFFVAESPRESALVRQCLSVLRRGPAKSASLNAAQHSDAVLVLGEDVPDTAPMLALAIRQAAKLAPRHAADKLGIPRWHDQAVRDLLQDAVGPLLVATPAATRLDALATVHRAAPDDIARLGLAIAHAIDPPLPPVAGLPATTAELADRIAHWLMAAACPLVVSGTGCGSAAVIDAAAAVAGALCRRQKHCRIGLVVPCCNSLGAAMLADAPADGPASAVLELLRSGQAQTLVVAEADLHRAFGPADADAILAAARNVVAMDHLHTPTTDAADVLLPAATFAESNGTYVNAEGRAQRFFQVFVPQPADIRECWRWLGEAPAPGGAWDNIDRLHDEIALELPHLAGIAEAAPRADFRMAAQPVPRQTYRYTGRTSNFARIDVNEPTPPDDADSPLAFSMEGTPNQPPAALVTHVWAPGWNSINALNKFQQEVGGPLRQGPSGKRLIEPPADATAHNGAGPQAPPAFEPLGGDGRQLLALPAWHCFGSDELSSRSPGIAELAPRPYVALGAEDAAALCLAQGQAAAVRLGEQSCELVVRVDPSLPRGVAAIGAGLAGGPLIDGPTSISLKPAGGGA
jgi:NADH-quinone oxidoreductase subunit G